MNDTVLNKVQSIQIETGLDDLIQFGDRIREWLDQ